jgi:hypothetical protein
MVSGTQSRAIIKTTSIVADADTDVDTIPDAFDANDALRIMVLPS